MNVVRGATLCWTCCIALGCGGNQATIVDPQQPAPGPQKGLRASQIVICPDGATYDSAHNTCFATGAIDPGAARKQQNTEEAAASSSVTVRCTFRNGWVSVLPVSAYPRDDTFLMQALIGFAQEPDFWSSQSEYSSLQRYSAKRCSDSAQRFELPPGDYFVLAGESGTFSRRGSYDRNGYRRRVKVSPETPEALTIRQSDLTLTWNCISCPFVSFVDERGAYMPAFVVLAWRNERSRKGTDRVLVHQVPVRDGRIRLRVAEAEAELSHLDQLVLQLHGQVLTPVRGAALDAPDGATVEMRQGTQINVEYAVPGMRDGVVDVEVIAHGYYDPL